MTKEDTDNLNWEQKQAIKLEMEGRLPEMVEFHKKAGREKQAGKIVNEILDEESQSDKLVLAYNHILELLKEYLDIKEEYYNIIALWIIGTYTHKEFPTYPYLYLNAMKGSGKSRALRLITYLSHKGSQLNSLTEAVLFRTQGMLAIDEFEGAARKGMENLMELLNSAYKKGTKVMRMKKRKTLEGEEQVVEEFEVYRPIAIANINGMDNVLGDRCIRLTLEKSANKQIVNLIEFWEQDEKAQKIKEILTEIFLEEKEGVYLVQLVQFNRLRSIYKDWNNYVTSNYTNYTTYTNYTNYTNSTKTQKLFNLVVSSGLMGRELELSFPILMVADSINSIVVTKTTPNLLKTTLDTLETIMKEKREEATTENMDVSLLEFLSEEPVTTYFLTIAELTRRLKEGTGKNEEWINPKWMGRAMKRLNLIKEKRRSRKGIDIVPDYMKSQEKIKMFK
ncbi:MAG: hypothetical protein ACTSPI_17345 [Candidatus Heimdallarchaeaceae archaeon]